MCVSVCVCVYMAVCVAPLLTSVLQHTQGSPAQRLAGLVARTYNASAKMLDMSGLASRPELSGMTISFDNTRGVELLLGVISRRAPDVRRVRVDL